MQTNVVTENRSVSYLGKGWARGGKEVIKDHEETFGDYGQLLYLDCGDGFTSVIFVKTY